MLHFLFADRYQFLYKFINFTSILFLLLCFSIRIQLSRVYSCYIKAFRITAIHSFDITINIYHIYPAKLQDFASHLQKQ